MIHICLANDSRIQILQTPDDSSSVRVLDCMALKHNFNRMNSIKKGKKFKFLSSFRGKMASDWLKGFAHAQ